VRWATEGPRRRHDRRTLMFSTYTHIDSFDPGVEGLQHLMYGKQMWTLGKTRKEHKCCILGLIIPKGSKCFRPLTNKNNRMKRISELGMEQLKK
jgi:hypothetical protein